uniref:HTH CENPB-type domain-containing protein n=1 Tax=Amphimedon queenslandica TaxID=400682 RepID=A0A1X7UMU3_AMPQE
MAAAAEKAKETHRSFDVSFKLRVVEMAEKSNKSKAARIYNVDVRRVREWCQQKSELLEKNKCGQSTSKRLGGGGRKALYPDMEEVLLDWIVDVRSKHLRVSRQMIVDRAKGLSRDSAPEFKASRGWLGRFMKRKGLSLRRKTTVCQTVPADCIPKLISFILHIRKLQQLHQFRPGDIFAMDETACWLEMPGDTTVATTGARSVPLKTAEADGKKLKPFIVFKGKGTRLIKELQTIPGVVVVFSQNGWMNDDLTCDYMKKIVGSLSFNKRLMIWDAYKCHTSETTKRELDRLHLHTAVIPGGCTKYIQAADVVWNSIFKSQLRKSYDTWLSEPTVHEFTKSGNMKPPSRSLLCSWVKDAWDAVPPDTVTKSFLSCAITQSTCGKDDNEIHCFKPGQPCEAGRAALAHEMSLLNIQQDIDDDNDPFADDLDSDEDDLNEACIEDDENDPDFDSNSDSD